MINLKNTGLMLCLSISALLGACDDDDGDGGEVIHNDSGVDSGARDGSTTSLVDGGIDASASIDSSIPAGDASTGDASLATAYNVTLTTAQETTVPACSAGASAAGTATVTVSADNSTITVTVGYSGLSGAPSAGHIHSGAVGVSGPVVLPFAAPLDSPFTKTLTAADYKVAAGAPASFAEFVTALKAGNAYVNLHTVACGDGEIRGQIQ